MTKEIRPTVLLVDDEIVNVKVLSDVLKDEYEVIFATSGVEALRRVLETPPDIVLLDVMMPEMDGYAVCLRLQQDARTAAIPVIFVTALGAPESELKGLETGAVDYVTKPIRGELVKARIRSHLKYRTALRAAEPGRAHTAEAGLTERQKEVFAWVKQGKTNWEIARILGCSEENVKYHMKNILRVMGSYNRTQAVAGLGGRKPDGDS